MQDSPKSGWNNISARKQLAIGINEVTKALERNKLRLVLVCKSVKPPHMTSHLITLGRTRQVPACQVPRLSECVSRLLGLKCVLALGFKCCDGELDDTFADTVAAIVPKVPPLNVTWIPDTCPSEEAVKEEAGEVRGIKRKLEDEATETSETETPELISCALQPLKVKRIIPNPAKIRKSK
ncbi:ribonuclease P protein subunit p38 [Aplochiton taeniatus]